MKTLQRAISVLCASYLLFSQSVAVAADKSNITYISPAPGSALVSPQTNIIIRSADIVDKQSISSGSLIAVEGSRSGQHSGKLIVSDDGKTLVFTPANPFVLGEVATVSLHQGVQTLGNVNVQPTSFSFTITPTDRNAVKAANPLEGSSDESPAAPAKQSPLRIGKNDLTLDNPILPVDFPKLIVKDLGNTGSGYVFISSFGWTSSVVASPFLMILDDFGNPFFY